MVRPEPLEFAPWPPEPALRTLPQGAVSVGASQILLGIGASDAPPAPPVDLCGALFDEPGDEMLPVAFFTDHYCPNCRSLLTTLEAQKGIRITRHELPVLGEDSVVAARAALAAGRQGAGEAFQRRMRRATFAPTPAYLRNIAEGLGIDADRMLRDLDSREVEADLQSKMSLAASLGFGSVPVAVVGRTVVVGDVPARTIARLVEIERRATAPCPLRG